MSALVEHVRSRFKWVAPRCGCAVLCNYKDLLLLAAWPSLLQPKCALSHVTQRIAGTAKPMPINTERTHTAHIGNRDITVGSEFYGCAGIGNPHSQNSIPQYLLRFRFQLHSSSPSIFVIAYSKHSICRNNNKKPVKSCAPNGIIRSSSSLYFLCVYICVLCVWER